MVEAIVRKEEAFDLREEKTDGRKILLKVLIGLLIVLLAVELLFYIILVPVTSEVRLEITGTETMGYDEVCQLAGISGSEKWLHFNASSVATRLASNPLFESVTVSKQFPDTVNISFKERTPVAVCFGEIGGRTVPLEIDREGVAFRIGGTEIGNNIPLLTGLTFENPVAGMRLNERLKPLLQQIEYLENNHPVLLASVSEIKIEPKTYGGYDLVLYPVHTPVKVRTDKALNQDVIQYIMLVLDVVQAEIQDIDEIDIRAGTVAYRMKGEAI